MVREIAGKVFKVEFEGSENYMLVNAQDLKDVNTQIVEIEKSGDVVSGLYLLEKDGFTQISVRRGIKLDNITIGGVCHPNIFYRGGELEVIDMVLYINYKVDESTFDITKYAMDEEDLKDETLEEMFASFMMVSLEGETYNQLEEMNYEELDYRVVSDVSSDVEEIHQEVSDEEQKKAFEMIKEYVKTDAFKSELKRAFDFENNKA